MESKYIAMDAVLLLFLVVDIDEKNMYIKDAN